MPDTEGEEVLESEEVYPSPTNIKMSDNHAKYDLSGSF